MKIILMDCVNPVRKKGRKYAPVHDSFLWSKRDELLRLGIIKRNNSSAWACAPFVVPKPGSRELRLIIYLRPLNHQTVPSTSHLPSIET